MTRRPRGARHRVRLRRRATTRRSWEAKLRPDDAGDLRRDDHATRCCRCRTSRRSRGSRASATARLAHRQHVRDARQLPAARASASTSSLHSCTKYLNGHSDIVAGAVIGRRDARRAGHAQARSTSAARSIPHACFLLHRGMKTLARARAPPERERARRSRASSRARRASTRVNYPGLESHPQPRARAAAASRASAACCRFELKGGVDAAKRVHRARRRSRSRRRASAASRRLITRPATTSHVGLTPRGAQAARASPTAWCASRSGIEATEDLIEDLEQALRGVIAARTSAGVGLATSRFFLGLRRRSPAAKRRRARPVRRARGSARAARAGRPGRSAEAAALLEPAYGPAPADPEAAFLLARATFRSDQPAALPRRARRLLRSARRGQARDGRRRRGCCAAGSPSARASRRTRCRTTGQALAVAPDYAWAMQRLGSALADSGDPAELPAAIGWVEQAIAQAAGAARGALHARAALSPGGPHGRRRPRGDDPPAPEPDERQHRQHARVGDGRSSRPTRSSRRCCRNGSRGGSR